MWRLAIWLIKYHKLWGIFATLKLSGFCKISRRRAEEFVMAGKEKNQEILGEFQLFSCSILEAKKSGSLRRFVNILMFCARRGSSLPTDMFGKLRRQKNASWNANKLFSRIVYKNIAFSAKEMKKSSIGSSNRNVRYIKKLNVFS